MINELTYYSSTPSLKMCIVADLSLQHKLSCFVICCMQMLSQHSRRLKNPFCCAFYSCGHCTESPLSLSHQISWIRMPCRVQKVWDAINIDLLLLVPSQQQRTRNEIAAPCVASLVSGCFWSGTKRNSPEL